MYDLHNDSKKIDYDYTFEKSKITRPNTTLDMV